MSNESLGLAKVRTVSEMFEKKCLRCKYEKCGKSSCPSC